MDLDEAVHNYVNHLANDYGKNGYNNKKFYAVHGRKYLHIVMEDNQRSSHSWVMLVDDKKFNRGDILKSASWNAPARNFKRGNVLTGEFKHIRWCGA
jgi:hypothetical protein